MPNHILLTLIALTCCLLLMFDARQSIKTGEFRFGLYWGLLLNPIVRARRPRLFWFLVSGWMVAAILGLALAIGFLLA